MTGMTGRCSRRSLLAATLAGLGRARAAAAPRVAVLDWGWAATALALGVAPAGVAEQPSYARWVGEPALPLGTAELGLRAAPSFETLAALAPDLILTNTLDAPIRPTLERIAPTLDNPTFGASRTPLAGARAATRLLGERLGRAAEADRLLDATEARFVAARGRVAAVTARPVVPIQFFDGRHLTFYGRGSLYGDVLGGLDLRNAFAGATTPWGTAIGDIGRLGALPPAALLLVDPLPPASRAIVDGPSLFTAVVAAAGHRLHRLPAVWPFGDLTAAGRFADRVAEALAGPEAPATGVPRDG